jgi:hypothetical protein
LGAKVINEHRSIYLQLTSSKPFREVASQVLWAEYKRKNANEEAPVLKNELV